MIALAGILLDFLYRRSLYSAPSNPWAVLSWAVRQACVTAPAGLCTQRQRHSHTGVLLFLFLVLDISAAGQVPTKACSLNWWVLRWGGHRFSRWVGRSSISSLVFSHGRMGNLGRSVFGVNHSVAAACLQTRQDDTSKCNSTKSRECSNPTNRCPVSLNPYLFSLLTQPSLNYCQLSWQDTASVSSLELPANCCSVNLCYW